jgi:hypothetical protein
VAWLGQDDFTQMFVIIVGMDECPTSRGNTQGQDEHRLLLELLDTMKGRDWQNLHLLLASRQEPDIENALQKRLWSPRAQRLELSTRCHTTSISDDINLQVNTELAHYTSSGEVAYLANKQLGRFQYVSLQLNTFQAPVFEEDVEEITSSLPKDLPEIYDKAFDRIVPGGHQQAIRAPT